MSLKDFDLPQIAREGAWFDFVDKLTGEKKPPGVRVKLASSDQEGYQTALRQPAREYAAKVAQTGSRRALPSDDDQTQAVIQGVAKHVLLDWDGVTDNDGKPFPCTQQNKLQLLKVQRFRDSIIAMAENLKAFEEQELLDSSSSPNTTSG